MKGSAKVAAAGFRRLATAGIPLIAFTAAIVAAWQFLPGTVVPVAAFGRPSATAHQLVELVLKGGAASSLGQTLYVSALSMAIGGPLGVLIALLVSIPIVRWLVEPVMIITYATPKVALVTFFVLWFGLTTRSHIALAVSIVMFVFFINMRQAITGVDANLIRSARAMGASWVQVQRLIVYPSVMPSVYAATRIAAPLAYGGVILAEMFIPTSSGLGALIERYSNDVDASGVIAVVIIVAAVGYVIDAAVGAQLRRSAARVGMGRMHL